MGEKYSDRQRAPHNDQEAFSGQGERFRPAEDTKFFTGFGANNADLERGFCEVSPEEMPDRDMANYKDRWTRPRVSDEDSEYGESLPPDVEFRRKDRETKGLFMRPRIPIER